MNIKPLNQTSTIQFAPLVKHKYFKAKIIRDPQRIISNGLYKVVRWEVFRQTSIIVATGIILLAMMIWAVLLATLFHSKGIAYFLPIIISLVSGYKFFEICMEKSNFKKALVKYRYDMQKGVSHCPPFMVKMYAKLHTNQVSHNGLTFFLLLHGGLFTILLGSLKNISGGILNFQEWISYLFPNPLLVQGLFIAGLLFTGLLHIIFAIQRKKRILEIDSYFGINVISHADLVTLKKAKNKFYRRLFMVYILVILIIPILVKLIMRIFRIKK